MVAGMLEAATQRAWQGDLLQAREMLLLLLAECDPQDANQRVSVLIHNQLACVEAALGDSEGAVLRLQGLQNPDIHQTAASQREAAFFVEGESNDAELQPDFAVVHNLAVLRPRTGVAAGAPDAAMAQPRQRTAIVSLLFNWPSTGGGAVHTKELAEHLARSGDAVRHFYAIYAPWGIGRVDDSLNYETCPLAFSVSEWHEPGIRAKFQQAIQEFQPDWVIVTDSWNSKPLLVEAAAGFRTLIRIAAQECLCPLNNVRLLVDEQGSPQQCPLHQFQNPADCCGCVARNGSQLSGPLHQAERELVGYGTPEYDRRLRQAFAGAAGVLVVNPFIAELVRPYAKSVQVIPSGFDERRFKNLLPLPALEGRPLRFLFAGLLPEFMKGFHVLRAAAQLLRLRRQDFEVWATGDAEEVAEPWLQCVGWQSQEQLPGLICQCDVLVFPTIAQEALGRTAVEAMGCGRAVIASRIGGLAWVVDEGVTGLMATPGDPSDLANQMEQLLEDAALRKQLGVAGREKFLREFTWDRVIAQHYRPLLGTPVCGQSRIHSARPVDSEAASRQKREETIALSNQVVASIDDRGP